MVRRVSVPGADELFRSTDESAPAEANAPAVRAPRGRTATGTTEADRLPSGRVRHDEKMTVYVTPDELLDLESARLALRSRHGLAVDRGRLVREAIAMALVDLEEHGEESHLVRRLTEP